jgi:hypothetical protein
MIYGVTLLVILGAVCLLVAIGMGDPAKDVPTPKPPPGYSPHRSAVNEETPP